MCPIFSESTSKWWARSRFARDVMTYRTADALKKGSFSRAETWLWSENQQLNSISSSSVLLLAGSLSSLIKALCCFFLCPGRPGRFFTQYRVAQKSLFISKSRSFGSWSKSHLASPLYKVCRAKVTFNFYSDRAVSNWIEMGRQLGDKNIILPKKRKKLWTRDHVLCIKSPPERE